MSFPIKLKALREAAGFTQASLASKMKLPAAMVSHYETGIRKPGLDNLLKIIKALKCEPNDLLK